MSLHSWIGTKSCPQITPNFNRFMGQIWTVRYFRKCYAPAMSNIFQMSR
ncbi:hypothetical protein [Moraxella lacunata]